MENIKNRVAILVEKVPFYPFFISAALILQLVIINLPKNVSIRNGFMLILLVVICEVGLLFIINYFAHNILLSGALLGVFSVLFLSYYNLYLFALQNFKQLTLEQFTAAYALIFIGLIIPIILTRKSKALRYSAIFLNFFTAFFLVLSITNLSFGYLNNKNNPPIVEQYVNAEITKTTSNDSLPNIYYFIFDTALDVQTASKYFNTNTQEAEKALASKEFTLYHNAGFEGLHLTMAAMSCLFNPTSYDNGLKDYMAQYSAEGYTAENYIETQMKYYNARAGQFDELYNNPEFIHVLKSAGYNTTRITMTRPKQLEPYDISYSYSVLDPFFNDIYAIFCAATPIDLIFQKLTGHAAIAPATFGDASADNAEDIYRGYANQPSVFQKSIEKTYNTNSPKFVYAHILLPHYPFIFDSKGNWKITSDSFAITQYKPQYEYTMTYMAQLMADVIAHDPDAMIVIQGDHGLTENYLDMEGFSVTPEEHQEIGTNIFLAVRQSSKLPLQIPENVTALDIPRYIMNNVADTKYPYIINK